MLFCAQNQKSSQKIAIFFYPRAHNIAGEGNFRDDERWLSRARAIFAITSVGYRERGHFSR